jgi:uncharacterized membrane protein YfcA
VDPSLLDIAGAAGIVLGALSSGVVGLGFPVIAVPLMTLAYGLEATVVVTTLPTIAIDVVNLWANRSHRGETPIVAFTMWAIIGAGVGVVVRDNVAETALIVLLIVVLSLYLVTQMSRVDLRRAARHPATSVTAGGLAGMFQATIGVSGPVVGIFFINRTSTREAFIYSAAVAFTLSGAVRGIGLTLTGAFTSERLVAGIAIAAVAVTIRGLGALYGSKMDVRAFRHGFTTILVLSLVSLVFKVV